MGEIDTKTTAVKILKEYSPTWIPRPFQEFAHAEASGGIVLLICTVIALIWANSPWAESYNSLQQTTFSIGFGNAVITKPLLLWINDGLMAIFFFVVGLEIKRELLIGELSSIKQAALPIAGAIGGMVVPAAIYYTFNRGTEGVSGWGIPMATDIAFAVGIMALLGNRVPAGLKVFLVALAIVDDIGAVLVIALFYTSTLYWSYLGLALACFLLLVLFNRIGVRHPAMYAIPGLVLWFAFLKSGIHATIAGVVLALTIPFRTRIDYGEFVERSRELLTEIAGAKEAGKTPVDDEGQRAALKALEQLSENAQSPMQRLEHDLHLWVALFIMPVFALMNAGVSLGGDLSSAFRNPIFIGVAAGLIIGKQVGVWLFSFLAVKSGLATLPSNVDWKEIYGAAWLAGIGFTMSLFIAGLALDNFELLEVAKIGILSASLVAGVVGFILLRLSARN